LPINVDRIGRATQGTRSGLGLSDSPRLIGPVPPCHTKGTTIPIWKKKGSPAHCFNCRPIRLLSLSVKIFERVLNKRIPGIIKLSYNQFGFVSGWGTIDAIHAARLLVEKHRERQKPVHLAFIDLEKAFDRVPREVIWYALRQHNVPEELIEWKTVPWTLLYADDVMLACEDKGELERQVQAWRDRLAMFELKLNVKKTEYPTTDVNESGSIGLTFGPVKWRSLTGVLCDRKIPERLEPKIYRTVVRPVAMYGAECWPATKEVEKRLSVMETKMLRWTARVTRMDRNDAIRQKFGVAPIVDKMREARLRWYGHVLRGKEDSVRKIELEVSGKRPRGRPKQRWSDTLHMDLKAADVHPDLALDRERGVVTPEQRSPRRCWTNAEEGSPVNQRL
uniref:Reverse transcriptase domain-containing protein n=1 Tax=Heligmosomoides polygyrus TaxID=6339 RepID=A0A183F2B7_HELPZ